MFIDETAVKTNLTRLRGRSLRGRKLTMDAPFGSWGTQTRIAGLTHDALIAPWVIKGAMNGPAFAAYIREVLVPEIEPGTVVIQDNLATHKNKEAAEALHAHGCWFLFLLPLEGEHTKMDDVLLKGGKVGVRDMANFAQRKVLNFLAQENCSRAPPLVENKKGREKRSPFRMSWDARLRRSMPSVQDGIQTRCGALRRPDLLWCGCTANASTAEW